MGSILQGKNFLLLRGKNTEELLSFTLMLFITNTVDSRYLELEGTLWNTSRYTEFDISDVQNWGKYQSNNQISQKNMYFDSFS